MPCDELYSSPMRSPLVVATPSCKPPKEVGVGGISEFYMEVNSVISSRPIWQRKIFIRLIRQHPGIFGDLQLFTSARQDYAL